MHMKILNYYLLEFFFNNVNIPMFVISTSHIETSLKSVIINEEK